MIPYGKQDISQADIDAVVEALKSDFLTQGPKVPLFESSIVEYCGVNYAVAVNSATSALHIACLSLGLAEGDYLWTSPISFVASANCALYCGAKVDFVDIDLKTYNLCPIELEKKLEWAAVNNCLPKIVVPVHLCGQPCDMAAIRKLAERYRFSIIEDASHAIGGKYLGHPVGSCEYSDITVFSFHPVKIITTAEGGVAVTNNEGLAEKMSLLRSHGVTRDPKKMTEDSHGAWYYQQIDLGFNYRMTDLQAALGISQLEKLDIFVARRHELAKRYDDLLSELPVRIPFQLEGTYSGLHLYVIQLDDKLCSRREVFEGLRANGVGVNLHYIPIHTQPYYRAMGFHDTQFPNAIDYYKKSISLPMFHLMTNEQQDMVVSVLRNVLRR